MMRVHDLIVQSSTSITKSTHVNASGKDIHEECGETFGHRDGDDIENVRSRLVEILTDQMSACQRPLCKKNELLKEQQQIAAGDFDSAKKATKSISFFSFFPNINRVA